MVNNDFKKLHHVCWSCVFLNDSCSMHLNFPGDILVWMLCDIIRNRWWDLWNDAPLTLHMTENACFSIDVTFRVRPAVWRSEVSFFLKAKLHHDEPPKNMSRGMMGDPERGFLPVFGQTLRRASPPTCSTLNPLLLRQRNPTRPDPPSVHWTDW